LRGGAFSALTAGMAGTDGKRFWRLSRDILYPSRDISLLATSEHLPCSSALPRQNNGMVFVYR
jgi:hypothetical protein